MGVKRRLNGYSGMRVDWPHIRSIESAISFDFDSVLRGMVTGLDKPYLVRGFDIRIPDAAIAANNLQVDVADTVILHTTAGESGTIFTIPNGTAADTLNNSNSRVIGEFQNGVNNYVSIELVRTTDPLSVDQTAGWSESQKTEAQRTSPIGTALDYRYIITTSGFSTNLPLFLVGVSPTGAVTFIQNSRPNLFRLGSGGTVPNPNYSFNFGNITNSQNPLSPRREWINESPTVNSNPVTVVPGDDALAFNYGDFSIKSLKDWMDAMMTRIKEVTGSAYWYTDSTLLGGNINTFDLWWDSVGSVMTGAGSVSYNLILEIPGITNGALQVSSLDNTIRPGDSYVVGGTSLNKANLQAYNTTQLVINSPTREDFVFDEVLRNRRVWRPNISIFSLKDEIEVSTGKTLAHLTRPNQTVLPTLIPVSTWTYSGNLITINTTGAHGRSVGDHIALTGFETSTLKGLPNGSRLVKSVPSSTQLIVSSPVVPDGTPLATAGDSISLDTAVSHPYMPKYPVTSYNQSGGFVYLTIPNHGFVTGDDIVVSGLLGTNAPNGRYLSITVEPNRTIKFAYAPVIASPSVDASSVIRYDKYQFYLTVEGSITEDYNKTDVLATAYDDVSLSYIMGPDTLPDMATAAGAISFDGVVAVSSVANPAQITSIDNDGTGILTITTTSAHGFTNAPSTSFTIFGDPTLSPYVRTYSNMDLVSISPTSFSLTPIGVNATYVIAPDFTFNILSPINMYARSPSNPYAGPIQWDKDIVVKAVIGDKYYRIPATATATGTNTANRFNNNGLTGTAFLQNGEVAYIELLRNRIASGGATYSCTTPSTITGSTPPTDDIGAPLKAGDFVKFESDSEDKWVRIAGTIGTNIVTNSFQLESDNGQTPSSAQRPVSTGRLMYSRATYDTVTVKPYHLVTPSPDIYWIAVRRDNGSAKSKVYFRGLELEQGEVRQINDNEMSNLLLYTGANTESAVSPNYTVADSGVYGPTETLTVISGSGAIDTKTRMVTFISGPELGFSTGDKITFDVMSVPITLVVDQILSSKTVIFKDDVSDLVAGQSVTYVRVNYKILDTDNLTLSARKMNREASRINTALERPIYDESVYPSQINISGAGTIKSGSYIYQGTESSPTALAWVLHGNAAVTETIEGISVSMPGGHPSLGSSAILVNIISGTWSHASAIFQNGANTGRTVNNSGDPEFTSPALAGGANGIELVLPPNRRTAIQGVSIVVWPTHSNYKASLDPSLSGEELMVIANDTIREATIDYTETFGGPKAKIKIFRDMPPKTRLRFRIMPAFGSALAKLSGSIYLQDAYAGGLGRNITTIAGLPVVIQAGDAIVGGTAQQISGSLEINGQGSSPTDIVGGIFGPRSPSNADQAFLVGKESNKPKEVWAGSDFVKSHSGYTGSAWTRKTASGVSSGAGVTSISSSFVTVPVNTSARIAMNVTARKTSGFGVASFRIEGTFYNVGAGAVAAGSPTTIHYGGSGDGDLYAINFAVSGNDVVLVVYGTSGSTVQWVTGIDYQILADSI